MKRIFALILAMLVVLSMAACGAKPEPTEAPKEPADLNALYESYTANLPAMFPIDETTMLNFVGMKAEDCTQVVIAVCANGLRTDEVWLVEAKDTAALERIQALVNSRLAAKEDETISYAPDQYAVVEQAEVVTDGLYLALLVSPDVDTLKATFEAAFN